MSEFPKHHVLSAIAQASLIADYAANRRTPSHLTCATAIGGETTYDDVVLMLANVPQVFPKAWAAVASSTPGMWIVTDRSTPMRQCVDVLHVMLTRAGVGDEIANMPASNEQHAAIAAAKLVISDADIAYGNDWLRRARETRKQVIFDFIRAILPDAIITMDAAGYRVALGDRALDLRGRFVTGTAEGDRSIWLVDRGPGTLNVDLLKLLQDFREGKGTTLREFQDGAE